MKLNKMSASILCALALTALATPPGQAQTYPERPIRWVVPYPPGGGGDILGRLLAQKLTEVLPHPVVVENRAGAAGVVGTDSVAKAPGDAYVLIFGTNVTHAIVSSLYPKLPYDPVKDFSPITNLVAVTNVLVVTPSLSASSVQELLALAKAKPGALFYASAGSGSNAHLAMEMLKSMTGADMVHTPYKGVGPAVTDLLVGRVQLMISNVPPVESHIKSGKLKALATTGNKRASSLPQLPTVAESGVPGYESDAWWAVLGPSGMPKAAVDRLNTEFVKILRAPEVRARLMSMGLEPIGGTPEQLASTIRADIVRWARVVQQSGAKLE